MISFKKLWPHWTLALASFCLTLFLMPQLPAQVPLHWNWAGQVDRYGDRITILLFPAIMLGMVALAWLLPRIDPRRENYQLFSASYLQLMFVIQLFLTAFHGCVLVETLYPGSIDMTTIVLAGCGLLFALIGNLLPKIKHNYFAGFRTPWTLNSEETWYATHRLGGQIWFYGGLIAAVSAFLPSSYSLIIFLTVTAICAIVPLVYSYWHYQRHSHM